MADSYTRVIGTGTIGEKARQLDEKSPVLEQYDLAPNRRTVLAEGFLDGFFQENDIADGLRAAELKRDIETRIRNGRLTRKQYQALAEATEPYGNIPAAIRSSAEGDARGTGIYTSRYVANKPEALASAFTDVLASYFSRDAVAYRKRAGLPEGFAIIVEPVVGQVVGDYFVLPLSGFGYTSTSRTDAYIRVVPGFFDAVSTKKGIVLDRELMMMNRESATKNLATELLGIAFHSDIRANTFMGYLGTGEPVEQTAFDIARSEFVTRKVALGKESCIELLNMDVLGLFDRLKRVEEALGPQYFEFGLTADGNVVCHVVQISDIDKNLDYMDFGEGKVLLDADRVTGTGIRKCRGLVWCARKEDIETLDDFNASHTGYVLVYKEKLAALYRRMKFANYSNASVLVEDQEYSGRSLVITMDALDHRTEDPVSHLCGAAAKAGMLIGATRVIDGLRFSDLPYSVLGDNMWFIDRDFEVIASERQDRLQVLISDDA